MAPANQVVKDFTLARINLVMGADSIVRKLRQGQGLALVRDPKDAYDKNAVFVVAGTPRGNYKIGYLPPGLAAEIAPLMDASVKVIARRAPNPMYGVCQVAYIPPTQPETTTARADGARPEGLRSLPERPVDNTGDYLPSPSEKEAADVEPAPEIPDRDAE